MRQPPAVFAVIGDLVGSRRADSRSLLHSTVSRVLTEVSAEVAWLQPLAPTVGDEFQAVYANFAEAARATLLVRLLLLPTYDVRVGIGYGEVKLVDAERQPVIQDGSGWWNARAALEELGVKARRDRRTWLASDPSRPPWPGSRDVVDIVNAHFTCRDALVDRLGPSGRRILLGSLRGLTQAALGNELQITQGAISQQFARGVSAVRDAQLLLEGGA